jgi:ADP-heptose:LPS heptosyltransferase
MKILIIRCGALGDLVYTTSVIDAMKLQFTDDAIIDFVCTPESGKLFDEDTRVNKVFVLKHKKIPIWLSNQKKEIIRASRDNPYDILINFEYGKQFKSLVNNIKARKKIKACDIRIPTNLEHMVEKTKYIFKSLVDDTIFNSCFPKLRGTNVDTVKSKYNLSNKYLIISPSNSHQKRNIINYRAWENSKWIKLIKKLSSKIQIVIIGNKGENKFFNKLKPYPNNVIDLVGITSLVDLVGVIGGAIGLISTDTGTAHIASAVDTEVFVLIGPTPANKTAPYQSPTNKVHIISANLPCSPCYKTEVMKKCKDNICMKNISVDMVINEILQSNILKEIK